jgi:hypothetical protein
VRFVDHSWHSGVTKLALYTGDLLVNRKHNYSYQNKDLSTRVGRTQRETRSNRRGFDQG